MNAPVNTNEHAMLYEHTWARNEINEWHYWRWLKCHNINITINDIHTNTMINQTID